ncbi:MAG TPA: arylmalonate decarboxylase [Solirubrobacteraceae bacterium]|nr:arylmalonate decarboxylase [Solirubrobacteraceae bacterium]
MTDALGWRATFGVIAPSTNTVVEPDFHRMTVRGVTSHMGRIWIRDQQMSDNEKFQALRAQIQAETDAACERVLTCEPDRMVMGMSAETFWGGIEGNRQFTERIESLTGLPVTTGAAATHRALQVLGASRIAVITPYQPIADENVTRFFTESGYEVVRLEGLRCPTAVSIARVSEERLRDVLRAIDGDDIDAILQVGTNLSMVRLADEACGWLGKPVLAINAATWWAALRDHGIEDQFEGAGPLLRDH